MVRARREIRSRVASERERKEQLDRELELKTPYFFKTGRERTFDLVSDRAAVLKPFANMFQICSSSDEQAFNDF